jgi:hypothetical protein
MLPISIEEKEGFRELIEYLEPIFLMPTRFKVKELLKGMKLFLEEMIRNELALMDSVNISLDGWSDAIMRCFNGFIAQSKLIINIFLFYCFLVIMNQLIRH